MGESSKEHGIFSREVKRRKWREEKEFPQTFNHKSLKPPSISHEDQPEINPSTTPKSQSKSLSIYNSFPPHFSIRLKALQSFPHISIDSSPFFTTLCNNAFAKAMVPLCLLFALHSLTPTTQKPFHLLWLIFHLKSFRFLFTRHFASTSVNLPPAWTIIDPNHLRWQWRDGSMHFEMMARQHSTHSPIGRLWREMFRLLPSLFSSLHSTLHF
jgi:hypothetical protein